MRTSYIIFLSIILFVFIDKHPVYAQQDFNFLYLMSQVERNDPQAIGQLAQHLYFGDRLKANKEEAINLFTKAADLGDVTSIGYLAQISLKEKDYEKALYYYQLLADKGYVSANNQLAYLYATGLGTVQNLAKAHELIDLLINSDIPDNEKANAYDSKGEFYLMENNREKAKEMLDKALSINPSIATKQSNLYKAFYSN